MMDTVTDRSIFTTVCRIVNCPVMQGIVMNHMQCTGRGGATQTSKVEINPGSLSKESQELETIVMDMDMVTIKSDKKLPVSGKEVSS